jgi:hypothetical protein
MNHTWSATGTLWCKVIVQFLQCKPGNEKAWRLDLLLPTESACHFMQAFSLALLGMPIKSKLPFTLHRPPLLPWPSRGFIYTYSCGSVACLDLDLTWLVSKILEVHELVMPSAWGQLPLSGLENTFKFLVGVCWDKLLIPKHECLRQGTKVWENGEKLQQITITAPRFSIYVHLGVYL